MSGQELVYSFSWEHCQIIYYTLFAPLRNRITCIVLIQIHFIFFSYFHIQKYLGFVGVPHAQGE